MKQRRLFIVLLALVAILSACASDSSGNTGVTPSVVPTAYIDEGDAQTVDLVQIGFSLAGEGAFIDQLIADIEKECAANGFVFTLQRVKSAEQQINDIKSMLASGISVLVISPVEVDSLEAVLAECETEGVPVINIIDSINGRVSTLISPDYNMAGQKAGEHAVSLFGETEGRCLELKTQYDSFIMQLLSDGFSKALSQSEKVTLVSEQFCGEDEEQAYLLAKTELLSGEKDIDLVFAHSANLAYGALRAIADTKSDARLVAFAGDMDLIAAVASGNMEAAVFIGPAQLARIAVENAGLAIDNPSYAPEPYLALDINVITAQNAADYYSEDNVHAQVKTN